MFALFRRCALVLLCCHTLTTSATTILAPSFLELVSESEWVGRGVVRSVRTEEFDSPQGRGIRTIVEFEVERTLRGPARDTVTLVQLGGTAGGRTLRVLGLPEFQPGQRQIAFVARNGHVICPVVRGAYGRFLVHADGATGRESVVRDDGAPLLSLDQVALPLAGRLVAPSLLGRGAGMSLAEFETRIVAVAAQVPVSITRP